MPKKKENDFAPQIDFKEQTPEMQLKEVKPDPLFSNAFILLGFNPKWLYSEHIRSYSYPHGKGTLSRTEDRALLLSTASRESAP